MVHLTVEVNLNFAHRIGALRGCRKHKRREGHWRPVHRAMDHRRMMLLWNIQILIGCSTLPRMFWYASMATHSWSTQNLIAGIWCRFLRAKRSWRRRWMLVECGYSSHWWRAQIARKSSFHIDAQSTCNCSFDRLLQKLDLKFPALINHFETFGENLQENCLIQKVYVFYFI